MEKNDNVSEAFNRFAEERLKNHLAELHTRYENEKTDNETMELAYADHQKIYSRELDEKIKTLLSDETNAGLKSELENARKPFLDKLSLKQS
jgi:superoxide dismutase